MYVIRDKDTGRFVTSDSVFMGEDEIIYLSYTGEADGIEYCYIIKKAQQILHRLTNVLKNYGISKSFEIVEIERKSFPEGELITEYFPNVKLKIA